MSWLKESFRSSIRYKRSYIFGYFSNEIQLTQAQYFSSLNSRHKAQFLACRHKRLERDFSVVPTFKNVQFAFGTFWKQFSKNWTGYIPMFGAIKHKHQGYLWYRTLEDVPILEFITLFNMTDSFYSRFNIIELHVWMLLFQLPRQGRINSLVKKGVVEAMWLDAESRAKLIKKKNPYFRKDFTRLNNKFQVTLYLYDNGYLQDDVQLSNALWYNFFDKKNSDPRLLEALVEYVRHQMHELSQLNYEELQLDENRTIIWNSPRRFLKHLKD